MLNNRKSIIKKMGKVSESIFSGRRNVIPMADVQNVEKHYHNNEPDPCGYMVITKHTKWNFQEDFWENPIYLEKGEGEKFLSSWMTYRHELEKETLKIPSKNSDNKN